ncbi:MAG TPA: hypothetical protein VNV65_02245 [Candidatus Solibacter sp.]|nr:hypothetical protein [Candidatus Solibacter sp.]
MLGLQTAARPLLIAGIRYRYLGAVAVVLVVALLLVLYRRSRRPALDIRRLDAAEVQRYTAAFAAIEAEFQAQPQVAIGRARGTVEEVMRRMGFPDRVDAAQRGRDLAAYDRRAAAAYESAGKELRAGDNASLGLAMTGYREVLERLLATSPNS